MAEAAEQSCARDGGGPRRVLGPIDATCVVVGAIIGVGIFFTPSSVAAAAGSSNMTLVAWGVGGIIALLGALTFAELGGMYQRNGGQYEMLRDAFGPLPAFMFVFCNATAVQTGAIAAIAMICADRLVLAATGSAPEAGVQLGLSIVLIAGLVGANVVGVRWGSRIQNFTVYAKLATLGAVIAIAVFAAPDGQKTAQTIVQTDAAVTVGNGALATLGVLFAALVPAFFAFGGWQHAIWISGEVKRPGRNVPLAIVVGVAIVATVYFVVNWAYLRLLGYEGVVSSSAAAAESVGVVWRGAGRVIAGAVAVSAFGVLNAQFLSGPRLIFGMAQDGRFFEPFGKVSKRWGTPILAIALLGVMATALLWATSLSSSADKSIGLLLTGVVFVDALFLALTGASLVILRLKRPGADRPVHVPVYPLVPVLFVLSEVGILIGAWLVSEQRIAAAVGAAWIIVAGVVFLLFFRKASH